MQVVVDEILTYYQQTGQGKTVLLLHGWADNSATFATLQSTLAASYCTVSLDLPGFGHTQSPPVAWGLEEYARFVQKFLAKLGHDEVYAIIGHSNGGALTILGVAKKILKTDRIVLLASSGVRNTQRLRRLVLRIVAKTGKTVVFWLPRKHKRMLQRYLYGVAGSDMLVAPHLQETFKRTVSRDIQAEAAELRLPVLLINGSTDKAVPLSDGRKIAALIPGSHLEVLTGGHFIHQQQPSHTAKIIKEFLDA